MTFQLALLALPVFEPESVEVVPLPAMASWLRPHLLELLALVASLQGC